MGKIMRIFKEILLNLIMVSLIFVMVILMYFNWTKGLNIKSMPDDFMGYDYIVKFIEHEDTYDLDIQTQKFAIPSKIAIQNDGVLYSVMYDQTKSNEVYSELFFDIDDIDNSQLSIESSSLDAFSTALNEDNFAYLEFLCPISAILNIESDIFVTDMIMIKVDEHIELFIKSNEQYFKISIQQTDVDFEKFSSLSTDYTLILKDEGVINLVSDTSISVLKANISTASLNDETEKEVISTFLYNPAVVTSYETSFSEVIYVNEYSSISMTRDYVEFESTDPRGNIFNEQLELSATEMIDFSIDIFNEIYGAIDSGLVAHPSDFYYLDGQAVVVLSGKFNGIDVNLGEPFGIFAFSSSGLSYCKINMLVAISSQEKVLLIKSNLLDTDNKLVVGYDLQGNADWKYYFDKE